MERSGGAGVDKARRCVYVSDRPKSFRGGRMNLVSERLNVDDYEEAVELFYKRHWTDGLPVVLPTPRRVEALIEHVGRDPQESLGAIPPRGGEATLEKLAI